MNIAIEMQEILAKRVMYRPCEELQSELEIVTLVNICLFIIHNPK